MRKYSQGHTVIEHKLDTVVCNACGNEIVKNANGYFQDYIHIEKQWGYFSEKDGECHTLDICEDCYNQMIKGFKVPVEKAEKPLF